LKFWLIMLFIAALPTAVGAQNAGVALRWDKCYGEGTGTSLKTFACDTNAGRDQLVGSFISPNDLPEVTSLEFVVDLSSAPYFTDGGGIGPPIPAWWMFRNPGSCRRSALQVDFTPDPANQVCRAWNEGQLLGGIASYSIGFAGPSSARLIMGVAAGAGVLGSVVAGTEYSSFTLTISHVSSVGSGACSGCQTGMLLVFSSIQVSTPQVIGQPGFIKLSGPLNGVDSNFALWQGYPVPTRTTTWGAVKSLYR